MYNIQKDGKVLKTQIFSIKNQKEILNPDDAVFNHCQIFMYHL